MIKKLSQMLAVKQVSNGFYASKCSRFTAALFVISFLLFSVPLSAQRDSFDGVIGDPWLDNEGNHIQAHGGQVSKIGEKWWWVGENRSDDRSIMLYSSDDLYNWTSHGKAMRVVSNRDALDTDEYFTALYGHLSKEEKDLVYAGIARNKVIERPKLIHNEKTGKYIIWFHADDSNYGAAAAGVAIADEITGPYTFIKRSRLHQLPPEDYGNQWYEAVGNRGMARDMTLFKDDDGTAYIIYSSEENRTMFISRLNDEYTDLDVPQTPVGLAKNKEDFIRLFPGAQREAPAMFKYNGKYYMITSGATGWDPNQGRYWMADEIFGTWRNMGDPCVNESDIPHPANLTFRTQSTNVIPVDPANGKFIYMGDRWKSSNLRDSRYVWLPIIFKEDGKIELRSMEKWSLAFFDLKNDNSQFANSYFSLDELPENLNAQVLNHDTNLWEDKQLPITWDQVNVRSLQPTAPTSVNGTVVVNGENQIIRARLTYIPKGLLYYIDSGAEAGSDMYDAIKTKGLAPDLLNTNTYDQAFDAAKNWGYTGVIGQDISRLNQNSKDAYTSGWWAHQNKPIDYKLRVENGEYYLTVGFQEWWNSSRNIGVSLIYSNDQGNDSTVKVLGYFNNKTEGAQGFVFSLTDLNPDNPYITVRIEKTGSPDPLMSWLSLTSLDKSDMTELEKTYTLARGINNKNERYSVATYSDFETVFQYATEVLNKENPTSAEIEKAREDLITAQSELIHQFDNDQIITIDDISDQIYTGDSIKPKLRIIDGSNPFLKSIELEEGVHYTVSYSNNVNVSTAARQASITITAMGMYTGKRTVKFKIVEDTGNGVLVAQEDDHFNIYPNPVQQGEPVYLSLENNDAIEDVAIYSISGQLINRQKVSGEVTRIDLSVPSGIYLVKVKNRVVKLIVK